METSLNISDDTSESLNQGYESICWNEQFEVIHMNESNSTLIPFLLPKFNQRHQTVHQNLHSIHNVA